ncbi:MAG: hypothetical protein IKO68_03110 [Oscillospiraceae bacterium]|nr:hypothetical protein [Oscillospiraceae bacterium]
MKRRILAALLALLMMLALLPAQSLAADTGFQTEAVPDADYDGIPDEFDPAPNENSFSGNYKSGDFNASIAYTMDYREFFEDNTVYNKNIAGCSTWASQFTYETRTMVQSTRRPSLCGTRTDPPYPRSITLIS